MSSKKLTISLMILTIISLLLYQCPEEPPEPDYDIFLSAEEVFCSWVTLKVTISDSGNINNFMIKRDGEEIINTTLVNNDTLVTDSFLESDTDYTYHAYFLQGNTVKDSSDELIIHTTSPSSHEMTWILDTLGSGYDGTFLTDVAVINKNDAWVVGEIYTKDTYTYDSLGVWHKPYNAAHWDGEEWELVRIEAEFRGGIISPPVRSIFAFSEDDIWANYGYPLHGNGKKWTFYHLDDMGIGGGPICGCWGTSSSNMFFVGEFGTIVHYDGSEFELMDSGTDNYLKSVAGTKGIVWACGTDSWTGSKEMVEYRDGKWKRKEFSPGISVGDVEEVGAFGDYLYLAGNSELYIESALTGNYNTIIWSWINPDHRDGEYYSYTGMVINDHNDIFLSCGFGRIYHYNGETLHRYPVQLELSMSDIGGKDDFIVAVGATSSSGNIRGIVARGYR
ncbi:MAG: hypothetical protein ISS81_10660 [Candidatus Marinimicrobia bacterium]|nr:hypothetical protein [Candidatus Neomarinimicrobiota bacterium]